MVSVKHGLVTWILDECSAGAFMQVVSTLKRGVIPIVSRLFLLYDIRNWK